MPLLSYTEALALVLRYSDRILPVETIPLVLSSGRVLSEPTIAQEDIPSLPNSAMDGYAVRSADLHDASADSPATLRIIGESAAGSLFTGTLGTGEAVRIMTGGIIPDGADAVIEVESTSEIEGLLHAGRSIRSGESIRRAGEDIRAGSRVIEGGKLITPGDIGVLASLGIVNVPVRVKPTIGILATGNEVVEPFRTPAPGQLRNSSSAAIYAASSEMGGEPIDLGIARDSNEELEEKIEEGLRYDILLTTGGVSAGAYDFVQTMLPALGVEIRFHKVNIRPGKPLLFGTFGEQEHRTLVFGLPGNPVSSLVTFHQFVAPAIRALLGMTDRPFRLQAKLEHDIPGTDARRVFMRGVASTTGSEGVHVAATASQSSGAMSAMSRANCLIIIEEGSAPRRAGSMVEIELF